MSMLAERVPAATGVNVTLTGVLACGATVRGRVAGERANSAVFVPESPNAVITRGAVPVLLMFRTDGALVVFGNCSAKVRLDGFVAICGAVPFAERARELGLFVALLVITTEAERAPSAVGLTVMLMVVVAPAATEIGRVAFVIWKSSAAVPDDAMALIDRLALPVLLTVIERAVLVVFTN
jgi:hypothetical protein